MAETAGHDEVYADVAAFDTVRESFVTLHKVAGRAVVLTRMGDEVRAFDGTCTHGRFNFTTSRLFAGCEIECPIHGARFHAADGAVTKGPATRPLPQIPVIVADGMVKIRIDWPDPGARAAPVARRNSQQG